MRRCRLLALCAAFVLLAVAGGAGAAPNPVKRAPSLLWTSYPLNQRTTASPPFHPLRPPALAVGTGSSSGDEIVGTPLLALLALLGGVMALTALVAKGLIKEGATMMAARRTRAAEPEPEPASTEDAEPDLLVALRPAAVGEEEPDLAESQPKTPVAPRLAPVEDVAEVEPAQSEQAPSPPQPPPRVRQRPRLRPIEEQPEVEPPSAEAEEQEAEQQRPLDAEDATEPEAESESTHLWREVPPEQETEVAVERCRIRIWRGYFRYQLFVAPGGSANITRAFALSPYFKLSDLEAPGADAMAALRELLDQLEAEGWTVAREGQRWYSFTLERPL
jgi:hypothetical protein